MIIIRWIGIRWIRRRDSAKSCQRTKLKLKKFATLRHSPLFLSARQIRFDTVRFGWVRRWPANFPLIRRCGPPDSLKLDRSTQEILCGETKTTFLSTILQSLRSLSRSILFWAEMMMADDDDGASIGGGGGGACDGGVGSDDDG